MIRYLIDSSGLWRVLRDAGLRAAWSQTITAAGVGSCHPLRTEFRRSARNLDEYEQMNDMFAELYPDVPVPKTSWRWIEAAQYRLVRAGAHRALSPVDLLICATAAAQGLVVLHDDGDFAIAARFLDDVRERRIQDVPAEA
ncbi:MAG: PIN domain-containing protein [Sporichthyaceae bacterium]